MKLTTIKGAAAMAAMMTTLASGARAQAVQSVFLSKANVPLGVATTLDGQVLVETAPSNPFAPMRMGKYTPHAALVAEYTTGSINGSRLALDTGTGLIWCMQSSGQIRVLDPNTGQVTQAFHLRQIPIDTSHIYNVNTGLVDDFFGVIKTYSSWYDDIALLRRGNQLDMFVSGYSDLGCFPFVIRVRMIQGETPRAKLIVASSASSLGNSYFSVPYNQPRGIAVNRYGTVLVDLTLTNRAGVNTEFGITFAADFEPEQPVRPPQTILNGIYGKGFGAEGMATDDAGNFYVAATLATSIIYCEPRLDAAVLMLPGDLSRVTCLGGLADLSGTNFDLAHEVAATPSGDAVYLVSDKLISSNGGTGHVGYQGTIVKFGFTQGCSYTLNPVSRAHGAGAENGTVNVTVAAACAWQVKSDVPWITLKSAAGGSGNGTVSYSVAANTGTTLRSGTLNIAGYAFTITQATASCTTSISPGSSSFPSGGGAGSVSITTGAGCQWTAQSNTPWLTFTSATRGTGSGIVQYVVAVNTATAQRQGTLVVGGQAFTVTQAAAAPCSFTLSPAGRALTAAGGTATVNVVTGPGCAWTAKVNANLWLILLSGSSGTGSGTVTYWAQPNVTGFQRQGTLTVAGKTFTVTQVR